MRPYLFGLLSLSLFVGYLSCTSIRALAPLLKASPLAPLVKTPRRNFNGLSRFVPQCKAPRKSFNDFSLGALSRAASWNANYERVLELVPQYPVMRDVTAEQPMYIKQIALKKFHARDSRLVWTFSWASPEEFLDELKAYYKLSRAYQKRTNDPNAMEYELDGAVADTEKFKLCCGLGNVVMVKQYLAKGNVYSKINILNDCVTAAAMYDRVKVAEELLTNPSIKPKLRKRVRRELLSVAVYWGQSDIIEYLADHHLDLSSHDVESYRHFTKLYRYLKHSYPTRPNLHKQAALFCAKDFELFFDKVDSAFDVNLPLRRGGMNALMIYTEDGHLTAVKAILQFKGTDRNQVHRYQEIVDGQPEWIEETAYQKAVKTGDTFMIKLFEQVQAADET